MNVTIYTQQTCEHSQRAKDYLTEKGIAYVEKDVQVDPKHLEELQKASQGFWGVPVCIAVDDTGKESVLKGFTEGEYDEVFAQDKQEEQIPSQSVPDVVAPVQEPDVAPSQTVESKSQTTDTPQQDGLVGQDAQQGQRVGATDGDTVQTSSDQENVTQQNTVAEVQKDEKPQEELQGVLNQLENQTKPVQSTVQGDQSISPPANGEAADSTMPPVPDFPKS